MAPRSDLEDMLVSRGSNSMADLGSNSRNTLPLNGRIEAGELPGPPHLALPQHAREIPGAPRWLLSFARVIN